MKLLPLLLFGFGFSQHPMLAQEKADPAAQAFEDFEKRVSDYVKVHKTAISEVHKLKPTNSPEDIGGTNTILRGAFVPPGRPRPTATS